MFPLAINKLRVLSSSKLSASIIKPSFVDIFPLFNPFIVLPLSLISISDILKLNISSAFTNKLKKNTK